MHPQRLRADGAGAVAEERRHAGFLTTFTSACYLWAAIFAKRSHNLIEYLYHWC